MELIKRPVRDAPAQRATPSEQSHRPGWLCYGFQVLLLEGRETFEVVGESNFQNPLWNLRRTRLLLPGPYAAATSSNDA